MTYILDCAWVNKKTFPTGTLDYYRYFGNSGDFKNIMVSTTSGSYYGTNSISLNYGTTWRDFELFPGYPRILVYDTLCMNTDASLIVCSTYDYSTTFSPENNTVYKSTDYGVSWSIIPFFHVGGGNVMSRKIVMSDSGQYMYAKDGFHSNQIYYSQDYGASWSSFVTGIPSIISADIGCSSDGAVAIFIPYGRSSLLPRQLAYTANYGTDWNVSTYDLSGDELGAVAVNYTGNVIYSTPYSYATTNKKYIYKSKNYGSSWSKVLFPSYVPSPNYYYPYISTNGTGNCIRIGNHSYNYVFSRDYGVNWYLSKITKTPDYLTYISGPLSKRTYGDLGTYEAIGLIGSNQNIITDLYYGTDGFMKPYGQTRITIGD